MIRRPMRRSERYECPESPLRLLALTLSVFGASLMAPGRFEPAAQAQTLVLTETGLGARDLSIRMAPQVRVEVQTALRAMSDTELSLTYARIHATFRQFLGADDLSVARALLDYANLAEAELFRRNLARPEGTQSASRMGLDYELVL